MISWDAIFDFGLMFALLWFSVKKKSQKPIFSLPLPISLSASLLRCRCQPVAGHFPTSFHRTNAPQAIPEPVARGVLLECCWMSTKPADLPFGFKDVSHAGNICLSSNSQSACCIDFSFSPDKSKCKFFWYSQSTSCRNQNPSHHVNFYFFFFYHHRFALTEPSLKPILIVAY